MNRGQNPAQSTTAIQRERPKLLAAALFFFILAILGQMLWKTPLALLRDSPLSLDLRGDWQVCTFSGDLYPNELNCQWHSIKIPSSIPNTLMPETKGWAFFRKKIQTPAFCLEPNQVCNLVLAEVGDALEAQINSITIGRHGGIPPQDRYAKHYPVRFDLPSNIFKKIGDNEVLLLVRHLKKAQSGLIRAPIAIVPVENAFKIVQTITTQNVVLPLMLGFIILLMSVFSQLTLFFNRVSDRKLRALARYGGVSAVFLFSYSSIPREFLPIPLAGCIHFMLRFLMDWTFFELAMEMTHFLTMIRKPVRTVYSIVVAGFVLMYAFDPFATVRFSQYTGFNGSVFLSLRVDYLLVFGPYAYSFIGALKRRREIGFPIIVLFSLISVLALLGTFTFHGASGLPHFVIFYPFFVVLTLSIELWSNYLFTHERLVSESKLGKLAAQVAHDIQSPLAALKSVVHNSSLLPQSQRRLVTAVASRINAIADDLMIKYKSQALEGLPRFTFISAVVDSIIAEKMELLGDKPSIEIKSKIAPDVIAEGVPISTSDLSRILSNLINNSIEAIQEGNQGNILIEVQHKTNLVRMIIKDNGRGMNPDILSRLRTFGGTYGKSSGVGMGLQHAKELLAQIGGTLNMDSISGEGTEVTLEIPVAKTPTWCADRIDIRPGDRIVVLDDDESVTLLWQEKLKEFDVIYLKHPEDFDPARFPVESTRFIFDHEIAGTHLTGLDLIKAHGLGNRAVLATSYYNDPSIQATIIELNATILPKFMISTIKICYLNELEEPNYKETEPDLILIDNDALTREIWRLNAKRLGKRFLAVESEDAFRRVQVNLSVPIYIDKNLSQGVSGFDVAHRLNREGFRNIYITTGEQPETQPLIPFLQGIIGKEFPMGVEKVI